MTRLMAAAAVFLAAMAALWMPHPAQAAPGDPVTGGFTLASALSSTTPVIVWDGDYYRVLDGGGVIKTYSSTGVHQSGKDVDFSSDTDTTRPGIIWTGTDLQVLREPSTNDERVYTYTKSGADLTQGSYWSWPASTVFPDIALPPRYNSSSTTILGLYRTYYGYIYANGTKSWTGNNPSTSLPNSIDVGSSNHSAAWSSNDILYLFKHSSRNVYAIARLSNEAYTSTAFSYSSTLSFTLPSGPTYAGIVHNGTNLLIGTVDSATTTFNAYEADDPDSNGLPLGTDYIGALAGAVTDESGWKCIKDSTGQLIQSNNASITVHGFCADSDSNGMHVELHVSPNDTYDDVARFAETTGQWWFGETNSAYTFFDRRIYDDTYKSDTSDMAFMESSSSLTDSSRLGFDTHAISATQATFPGSTATGFKQDKGAYYALNTTSDTAAIVFSQVAANKLDNAATPSTPLEITIERSQDYRTATLRWKLYDPVDEYKIQRQILGEHTAGDSQQGLAYGDNRFPTITGTLAGISAYADATLEPDRSYRYRIQARGAGLNSWSDWSDWSYTDGQSRDILPAPQNLITERGPTSIVLRWDAPIYGDPTGYIVQRETLDVTQGGSNIGTNRVGFTGLPATPTSYTDTTSSSAGEYQYRVAGVVDGETGDYTPWVSDLPANITLPSPQYIRIAVGKGIERADRRELWLEWPSVQDATDYQVIVTDTTGALIDDLIVTDPTTFYTVYDSALAYVRARRLSATSCGAATDNRCLSSWVTPVAIQFSPELPTAPTPGPAPTDNSLTEMRDGARVFISTITNLIGVAPDPQIVINMLVALMALMAGSYSINRSLKQGLGALGLGMAAAVFVLILFTGHALVETPVYWAYIAQMVIAVPGVVGIVRQAGVFR